MKIFITGSAGFIGFHVARRLALQGHSVTGYDGMTSYYDVALKRQRLALLAEWSQFHSIEGLLENRQLLEESLTESAPDVIVHLAAQVGVRHSISAPDHYVRANLVGTFNLLEATRFVGPQHLLIASSSSVYGGNRTRPFRETARTDFPVSLYAATKKAGEAMSHSYAHLLGTPTSALRLFTAYGPWGRPDMALFRFVSAITEGRPVEIYGDSPMQRDFTFIDDLADAVVRLIDNPPQMGRPVVEGDVIDSLSPVAPWRAVNIAQGVPTSLNRLIEAIEGALGQKAARKVLPAQPGDVTDTYADVTLLRALIGRAPSTPIDDGVSKFVEWYRNWYDGRQTRRS